MLYYFFCNHREKKEPLVFCVYQPRSVRAFCWSCRRHEAVLISKSVTSWGICKVLHLWDLNFNFTFFNLGKPKSSMNLRRVKCSIRQAYIISLLSTSSTSPFKMSSKLLHFFKAKLWMLTIHNVSLTTTASFIFFFFSVTLNRKLGF